jgi:hypothetical protein
VVSGDVPPQTGEIDEQCIQHENANAAQVVCRQQDVDAAAVAAGQPAATLYQVPATNLQATLSMGDHPRGSGRSPTTG